MRLAQAGWLMLLPLLALLGLWLARADARRAADMAALGMPTLSAPAPDLRQRRRLRWRLIGGLALLLLALARPQWGNQSETVQREGRQVIVALDVSQSMLAGDMAPDRLSRAKLEIQALVDAMAGDQIGLVLFSGAAFTQVPLTVDQGMLFGLLEEARPGLISRPGTVIGEAIRAAQAGFDEHRLGGRAILLFSDGEDPEPGALDAAREAAAEGIVIHTVGFGSLEGARIPESDEAGRPLMRRAPDGSLTPAWMQDDAGQEVISRLEDSQLREIAAIAGGSYRKAGATGQAAAELAEALVGLESSQIEGDFGREPIERFQWPLALALLLLAWPAGWRLRRPGRVDHADHAEADERGSGMLRRPLSLVLLTLSLVPLSGCAEASAQLNEDGNRAFATEDWAAAAARYREALEADPDRVELLYNLGNAAYRMADPEAARNALQRALELEPEALTPEIWFNLGALALNLGENEAAVRAYQALLRTRPEDADARHNLELALAAAAQAPEATGSAEPSGSGTPPPGGTPTPGGSATPGGTPSPGSGTPTPGEGGEGGTPTPGAEGEGGSPTPSDDSESGEASEGDAQATLTPEQAKRLLEAISRDTETLQERLRQIYVVPGRPPVQRW
jgi:Ca-activated chloride channel family protein